MIKVMVERLREGPETVEINCPPREIGIEPEENYAFEAPVTGSVEFKLIGRDVQGTGGLHTEVKTRCVRCLEPVTVALDVPIEAVWLFHDPEAQDYEEPAPEEILAEYHNGEVIAPGETLRELLLMELPDFPLCKEDCKGLCPGCGVNLNLEKCRCVKKEEEKPVVTESADWRAALKKIKPAE